MPDRQADSIDVRVFPDPWELGEEVAALVADGIESSRRNGRRYVLGCPTGRSPAPTYAALAQLARSTNPDWHELILVMMDDYVTPTVDGFEHVADDAHYSCHRFAEHRIRRPINRHLGPGHRIPVGNVWFPRADDPAEFDGRIERNGGIDLFLLASGASDGHVAFCGPGSGPDSGTSIVELASSTRRDNMATFPGFNSLEEVPTHGVSVGLGTIRRLSRSVVMIMCGAAKQRSVQRVLAANTHEPEWPATIVHRCRQPHLWFDEEAAAVGARSIEAAAVAGRPGR